MALREVGAEGIDGTDEVLFPEFVTEAARRRTFRTWLKSSPIKPQDLVDAGFFYTGRSDRVRCFHCGEGLRAWEPGEDPWTEHARWSPQCGHVIRMKGEEFVAQVQRGFLTGVDELPSRVHEGRDQTDSAIHEEQELSGLLAQLWPTSGTVDDPENSCSQRKNDEFDKFGEFVAAQLRAMPVERALLAQIEVQEVLQRVRLTRGHVPLARTDPRPFP
ncbi:unnamed protein product [Darwinula stevensoni]|uniref:Uncharacterized protein n=1 Tax=Darwinula stevensoni TaxID=69355 RepID=A0A7R9A5G9_9CRUS|nr:unnamed protein product [Darwinula stevensoni]CAG0886460.1 unnamed protein product [Darwinula stevensoni]